MQLKLTIDCPTDNDDSNDGRSCIFTVTGRNEQEHAEKPVGSSSSSPFDIAVQDAIRKNELRSRALLSALTAIVVSMGLSLLAGMGVWVYSIWIGK